MTIMGRDIKRVPMDFDWPLQKVWSGYISPCDDIEDEQKQDECYEAFIDTEPPVGDGYQLWENVSAGSPVSPVFATANELAAWMQGAGYEDWAVNDVLKGQTYLPSGWASARTGFVGIMKPTTIFSARTNHS